MSKLLSALREVFRAIAFRDFTFERCSSAWRFGADHRAERLLVAALSPVQLAQYRKRGPFRGRRLPHGKSLSHPPQPSDERRAA